MSRNENIATDLDSLLASEWSQLQTLLTGCFGENGQSGGLAPRDLAELLPGLPPIPGQPLLASLPNIGDGQPLNADSRALAAFIDQLFNNYHKNNRLHPRMQQLLDLFRPTALLSLCRRQLPWNDPDSATAHLGMLLRATCGWQPELGRAAEKFMEQLQPLIERLTAAGDDGRDRALRELEQFLEREQGRVAKLERRLHEAEIGQLQAKHARQFSSKTLNQQMAGKKLPAEISHFLQGPWRESMRLLLLSDGQDSEQWRKILRLTETLVWSFQPLGADAPQEKRQHLYQSISELSEELREATVGLHHSSELDHELALVEAQHLKILKGEALEYQPFNLLENTDPLVNAQVSISNSLLKNVAGLDQGQWFLLSAPEGEKRIRLTIKIDRAQQLLFTNFLGIRAGQFSFEEFAYMLSSRTVVPIHNRDLLRATGEKMLDALLRRYRQQQETLARAKALEEERLLQEEEARETARRKALEEAKAHAEAAERARLQAQREEQQRQRQQEIQQRSERFASQLDALRMGARISIINGDGEGQTCRLAAILQSSGEYVFVDRTGVKQLAATREQLAELLLEDRIKIIDQGSNFENTLEQVVNNLRSRKST